MLKIEKKIFYLFNKINQGFFTKSLFHVMYVALFYNNIKKNFCLIMKNMHIFMMS